MATNATSEPLQELPPGKRRRLMYRALLRGLLTTAVLVTVYYLIPDKSLTGTAAVRVLIGLVIFVGVTAWQVRTIVDSRYPALKAAEALGLVFP